MITITRRQARRLRGVFRRHVLGIAHRGSVPALVLCAGGTQLRAHYRYATLAIEHVEPIPQRTDDETIALPLDALADFEGPDDSPVVLEACASDRIVVRWTDHGVPQSRESAVPALDTLKPFPDSPADWTTLPSDFLSTLAEASETASDDSTRYALNCLQLRGGTGEVAATDGQQLLIRGGFGFPWADDLLVRHSPIFANRALPRDQPVRIGRAATHVVLGAGPWTLFLEIQTGVRFPALGHIIPDPTAALTRLWLEPEDARFLGAALARLPGAAEPHAPATLELNGKVAVRARGADQTQPTELVLARSHYSGTPVRLNTNREFLARAVRLGFSEVAIVDAETPLVCRDRDLVYCWQPLAKESALEPTEDVLRIESPPVDGPTSVPTEATPAPGDEVTRVESTPTIHPTSVCDAVPPEARTTMSQPGATAMLHEQPHPIAAPENPDPAGLPALIQEAESLHRTLTDARARSGRLVVALRRHRRRERLVATTLASLKALGLQDVAG